MGGSKKPNRTKGNSRPSSSGRSAQLLANDNIGLQGFIGFHNKSCEKSVVPVTGAGFDDDSDTVGIDGDFRLIMRKMTKRDVITKLKAIQEFGEICKGKEIDALKAVLPFWPRIYNKLSFDHDRRVREATHLAHKALLVKVEKNVAPFLKALMGFWFIASSDMHAPASSAAMDALNVVFPGNRLPNALLHCKLEIMSLIENNLLKASAESLSDPSNASSEEIEAKYSNVVSASMLSLKSFLELVPADNHCQIKENVLTILSNSKFWKFGHHKIAKIQSSFFQMLSSLSKHMPDMLSEHAHECCLIVFSNLNSSNPLIAPYVWECALYITVMIADWWTHVNLKKVVIPQLVSFFRAKGYGNAPVIYPSILPLLSRFPEDFFESEKLAYIQLLDSVRQSLCGKVPKSAVNAIIKAYVECFSLIFNKVFKNELDLSDPKLAEFVHDHLIILLQSYIFEEHSLLHDSDLNRILRDALYASSTPKNFSILFWDQFDKMMDNLLEILFSVSESRMQVIFDRLYSLYAIFTRPLSHCNLSQTHKKEVRFSLSDKELENSSVTTDRLDIKDPCPVGENDKAVNSMKIVCEQIMTSNFFDATSIIFTAKMFLLVKEMNSSTDFCSISFDQFVLNKLTPLMELPIEDGKVDEERCFASKRNAVALVFLALTWIAEESKNLIFTKLLKIESMEVMEEVFMLAHSATDPAAKNWLNSSDVYDKLNSWIEKFFSCNNPKEIDRKKAKCFINILKLYISSDFASLESSKMVEKFLNHIFDEFKFSFKDGGTSVPRLSFLIEVYGTFLRQYRHKKLMKTSEHIALYLLQIICNQPPIALSDGLHESILALYEENVQTCIKISNSNKVLIDSIDWIKRTIATAGNFETFQVSITGMIDVVVPLLQQQDTLCPANLQNNEYIRKICFGELLYCASEWEIHDHVNISQFVLSLNILNGTGLSSAEFINISGREDHFDSSSCKLCWMASYSLKILHECHNYFLPELDEQEKLDQFCNVIHRIMTSSVIFMNAKYSLFHDEEQKKAASYLENLLTTYFQSLSNDLLTEIFHYLCSQCNVKGNLSVLVFEKYLQIMPPSLDLFNAALVEIVNDHNFYEKSFLVQTYGVLLPHINNFDSFEEIVKTSMSMLVSDDIFNFKEGENSIPKSAVLLYLQSTTLKFIEAPNTSQDLVNLIFKYFVELKEDGKKSFFFGRSFDDISSFQSCILCEILNLLYVLCEQNSGRMLFDHWDFLLCSLGDWVQGLQITNMDAILTNYSVQRMAISVTRLFNSVLRIVNKARKAPLPNKSNLIREWDEFFSKAFFPPFLRIFVFVAEHLGQSKMNSINRLISTELASALKYYPESIIECHSLPMKLVAEMEGDHQQIPDLIQTLLNYLCPLLTSSSSSVQYGAYFALLRVFPSLPMFDLKDGLDSKENEDDKISPPLPLLNILKATNEVMNALLEEAVIEEVFIADPFSEAFSVIRAHFLCWSLFEVFFTAASLELRPKYAVFLHDSELLDDLLLHIFKFMPTDRRSLKQLSINQNAVSSPMSDLPMPLHATENSNITEIQNLAYSVYYKALQCFPALIRQWWNSQDKRTYSFVEKFTSQNVSPHLSSQDIEAVHAAGKNFKNMAVKALPAAREVVATYIVDEVDNVSMEIIIQLPINYPLGVISVNGEHKGVGIGKWRCWMYQLNTFLMHQNGSILEGLNLWRGNVEQLYDGVEACNICFSIIHETTCQLPKKTCRTCKKKFHSACLYKWFNTSSQSSCPMCRNLY